MSDFRIPLLENSCAASDVTGNNAAKRKLIVAIVLCCIFFIIELAAGIYSNSLAILSDSFHLLSDIAGFAISLCAIYLSSLPATSKHSFGYFRAEILGALLSTFLIWILTAGLVYEAVERLKNPIEINAPVMFATAAVGVLINIVLASTLHHDHAHHDHDHHDHAHHDHHEQDEQHILHEPHQKTHTNINISAAAVHVIGDLVSSIGVLISSIIIWLFPALTIIDPLSTFIFSVIVLTTTISVVSSSVNVLMETTPKDVDSKKIVQDIKNIPGVINLHDLHIWCLTIGKSALAAHIEIDATGNHDDILQEAHEIICNHNIHHTTLQLERSGNASSHCAPHGCRTLDSED